jgi:DNA-binding HxlR family transcriptional regulator
MSMGSQSPPEQLRERAGTVPALGRPTLALLRAHGTIAVLLALEHATLRPHELERRLHPLSHGALMRRLAALARAGAIGRERTRTTPPRAYYTITTRGRALVAIAQAARRWEQRGSRGVRALQIVGDRQTLALLRELAAAPLGPRELGRRLAPVDPVAHPSLMRRLAALTRARLLMRVDQHARPRYSLTPRARELARLALMAMRCELDRLSDPADAPASDVAGMLRLLAPAVAVPEHLDGTFLLYVAGHGERRPSVCVRAAGGELLPAETGADGVAGFAVASVATWLGSLEGRPAPGLTAAGDLSAVSAILRGLSAHAHTRSQRVFLTHKDWRRAATPPPTWSVE